MITKESLVLHNPFRFGEALVGPEAVIGRDILPLLISQLANNFFLILKGSRRSGKTTIIKLLIKHLLNTGVSPRNVFYFSFDDLKLINEINQNPREFLSFIKNNAENNARVYVFLDEVQKNPDIFTYLKLFYDQQTNIKFTAIGSQSLGLEDLGSELLGRSLTYEISPLSFSEFISAKPQLTSSSALNEYLLWGAYPEIITSPQKEIILANIHRSYLEKDLIKTLRESSLAPFESVFRGLSFQIGSVVNYDELAKMSETAFRTVKKYLSILEKSYLINLVEPFSKNMRRAIVKRKKVFFEDLGLRNSLIGKTVLLENDTDKGHLFENFIYNQLLFTLRNKGLVEPINFFRRQDKTEVDFKWRDWWVEVKLTPSSRVNNSIIKTVKEGDGQLVVVHGGEETKREKGILWLSYKDFEEVATKKLLAPQNHHL